MLVPAPVPERGFDAGHGTYVPERGVSWGWYGICGFVLGLPAEKGSGKLHVVDEGAWGKVVFIGQGVMD